MLRRARNLSDAKGRLFDPGTCPKLPGLQRRKGQLTRAARCLRWIDRNWINCVFVTFLLFLLMPISTTTTPSVAFSFSCPNDFLVLLENNELYTSSDIEDMFGECFKLEDKEEMEPDGSGGFKKVIRQEKHLKNEGKETFYNLIHDMYVFNVFQTNTFENLMQELTKQAASSIGTVPLKRFIDEDIFIDVNQPWTIHNLLNVPGNPPESLDKIYKALVLAKEFQGLSSGPDFTSYITSQNGFLKYDSSPNPHFVCTKVGTLGLQFMFSIRQDPGSNTYLVVSNSDTAAPEFYDDTNKTVHLIYQLDVRFGDLRDFYGIFLELLANETMTFYGRMQFLATNANGKWKNPHKNIFCYCDGYVADLFRFLVPSLSETSLPSDYKDAIRRMKLESLRSGRFEDLMKLNFNEFTRDHNANLIKASEVKYTNIRQTMKNQELWNSAFSFEIPLKSSTSSENIYDGITIDTDVEDCYTKLEMEIFHTIFQYNKYNAINYKIGIFPSIIELSSITNFLPASLCAKSLLIKYYLKDIKNFVDALNNKYNALSKFDQIEAKLKAANCESLAGLLPPFLQHLPLKFIDEVLEIFEMPENLEFFEQSSTLYATYLTKLKGVLNSPVLSNGKTVVFSDDLDASAIDELKNELDKLYKQKRAEYEIAVETFEQAYKLEFNKDNTVLPGHILQPLNKFVKTRNIFFAGDKLPTPDEAKQILLKVVEFSFDQSINGATYSFVQTSNSLSIKYISGDLSKQFFFEVKLTMDNGKEKPTLVIDNRDCIAPELTCTKELLKSSGHDYLFKGPHYEFKGDPNNLVTTFVRQFQTKHAFLQTNLPLTYFNLDTDGKSRLDLFTSTSFASLLAAQSQNWIASHMQHLDITDSPPDYSECMKMFDLLDQGLFSKAIINEEVAKDSAALISLHQFLCNFTNYFFHIIKWKLLEMEAYEKKRASIPLARTVTDLDYMNFDESFVRFSAIWLLLNEKKKIKGVILDQILAHFAGMLNFLKAAKLPFYKAPKLHNIICSNYFVFQNLNETPAEAAKTQYTFVQTYSEPTKSFSIYCSYVYKGETERSSTTTHPDSSIVNNLTQLRFSGKTLFPTASNFYARLTSKLAQEAAQEVAGEIEKQKKSNKKSSSAPSVTDSIYTLAMRGFVSTFDKALATDKDPTINTTTASYGVNRGYKMKFTEEIDDGLILSILLLETELHIAANVKKCPVHITSLNGSKIKDSVCIHNLDPDFPVDVPLTHLCFSNSEQFWCYDRKDKEVVLFVLLNVDYFQDNAVILRSFLEDKFDIKHKTNLRYVTMKMRSFKDGMNSFKLCFDFGNTKHVIFPGFKYEGNDRLIFSENRLSTPNEFKCVTSAGFIYYPDFQLLGRASNFSSIVVYDQLSRSGKAGSSELYKDHLLKAFVAYKPDREKPNRTMFFEVKWNADLPVSPPIYYGYLDSTNRIEKLHSIRWLISDYPLVALEVFKNDYSVTTQPSEEEVKIFKELFFDNPPTLTVTGRLILLLIFQPFFSDLFVNHKDFLVPCCTEFINERAFLFVQAKNGFSDRPLAGYGHPYWENQIFSSFEIPLKQNITSKVTKIEIKPIGGTPINYSSHFKIDTSHLVSPPETKEETPLSTQTMHYQLAEFEEGDTIFEPSELNSEVTFTFDPALEADLLASQTNFNDQFNELKTKASKILLDTADMTFSEELIRKIDSLPLDALKSELSAGYRLRANFQLGKLNATIDEFKNELINLNATINTAEETITDLILDMYALKDYNRNILSKTELLGVNLTTGLGECFIKNSKKCFDSFFCSENIENDKGDHKDEFYKKIYEYLSFLYDMRSKSIMLTNFATNCPSQAFDSTAAPASPPPLPSKPTISVDDYQLLMSVRREKYISELFFSDKQIPTRYYYVLAAFETFKKLTVRNDQLFSVIYLMQTDVSAAGAANQNKILKLLMAAGKTSIIGPLLSILEPLKNPRSLVGFVPPVFLFESNVNEYTKELVKLGVHVFSFRYERHINLTEAEKSDITDRLKEDQKYAEKDVVRLTRIHDYLKYCIASRNVFMTTAESILCFMNRKIEFWTNPDPYSNCLKLMNDILELLRNHARVAFDESHITFNPFQMLIFPIGADKGVSLSTNLVDIVTAFLTSQLYSKCIDKKCHTFRCIFQMDIEDYISGSTGIEVAICRFFGYMAEKDTWFKLLYGDKLAAFFTHSKELKEFWMSKKAYYNAKDIYEAAPLYETINVVNSDIIVQNFYTEVMSKCANKKLCFEFAMMVHKLLHAFIPSVLQKSYNRDYGFHPDVLKAPQNCSKDLEDFYSIPYMAANKPSEKSKFANPFDVIVKTFQMYTVFGKFRSRNMKGFIDFIRSSSSNSQAWDVTFSSIIASEMNAVEIRSQERVKDVINTALTKILNSFNTGTAPTNSAKQLKQLDFISEFLKQTYFYTLKYDQYQIEGNASSFKYLLNRVYGYSGTPGPILIYSGSTQNSGSIGPLGSAAANLFLTNNTVKAHDVIVFDNDPDSSNKDEVFSFFDQLFSYVLDYKKPGHISKPFERYPYAIIDIAAVLKNFKNRQVARLLVEYLKSKALDYEGVVYYDEVLNIPAFYSKNGNTKLLSGMDAKAIRYEITREPEECNQSDKRYITYYDQQHITGADFRFFYNSDAFVLLDNRVQFSYLLQGIMRMRQFFKGQQIHLAISEEMKSNIFRYLKSNDLPIVGTIRVEDILTYTFRYEQDQYIKDIQQSFTQQIHAAQRAKIFGEDKIPDNPKDNSLLISRQDFSSPLEDCKSTEMDFGEFVSRSLGALDASGFPDLSTFQNRFSREHMVNLELDIQFGKYIKREHLNTATDYAAKLKILQDRNPNEITSELNFEFKKGEEVLWFDNYKKGLEDSYDLLFKTQTSMNVGSMNQSGEQENENRLQLEKSASQMAEIQHVPKAIEVNIEPIPMLLGIKLPTAESIKVPDLTHNEHYFYEISKVISNFKTDPKFSKVASSVSNFYISNNLVFSFKRTAAVEKELRLFDIDQKQLTDFLAVEQTDPDNKWWIMFVTPLEAQYYRNSSVKGTTKYFVCNIRELIYQSISGATDQFYDTGADSKLWKDQFWEDNITIRILILTGSIPLLNEFYVNKIGFCANLDSITAEQKAFRKRLLRLFHGPEGYRFIFTTIMKNILEPADFKNFALHLNQLPVSELLREKVDQLARFANMLRNISFNSVSDFRDFGNVVSQFDPNNFEEFEEKNIAVVCDKMGEFISRSISFVGHPVLNRVFCILHQFTVSCTARIRSVDPDKMQIYAAYAVVFSEAVSFTGNLIALNSTPHLFPKRQYQLNNKYIAHLACLFHSLIRPLPDVRNFKIIIDEYMNVTKNEQQELQSFPDYSGLSEYVFVNGVDKAGIKNISFIPTIESYCRLVCDSPCLQMKKESYIMVDGFKEALSRCTSASKITAEMLLYLFSKYHQEYSMKDMFLAERSHFLSKLTLIPHTQWREKILKKYRKLLVTEAHSFFIDKFEYTEVFRYMTNLSLLGYRDVLTPKLLLQVLETFTPENKDISALPDHIEYLTSFYYNNVAPLTTWKNVKKMLSMIKGKKITGSLNSYSMCMLTGALYIQGGVKIAQIAVVLKDSELSTLPANPMKPFIAITGEAKSNHKQLSGCLVAFLACSQENADKAVISASIAYMMKTPSLASSVLHAFARNSPPLVALILERHAGAHPGLLASFTHSTELSLLTGLPYSSPSNVWPAIESTIQQVEVNRSIPGSSEQNRSSLAYNANVYSAAKKVEKHNRTERISKIKSAAFTRNILVIIALTNLAILAVTVMTYCTLMFLKTKSVLSNVPIMPESIEMEALQSVEPTKA